MSMKHPFCTADVVPENAIIGCGWHFKGTRSISQKKKISGVLVCTAIQATMCCYILLLQKAVHRFNIRAHMSETTNLTMVVTSGNSAAPTAVQQLHRRQRGNMRMRRHRRLQESLFLVTSYMPT